MAEEVTTVNIDTSKKLSAPTIKIQRSVHVNKCLERHIKSVSVRQSLLMKKSS